MSDGGKGSRQRPRSVSNEDYANRWDAIFGRDLKNNNSSIPENTRQDDLSNENFLTEQNGNQLSGVKS